MEHLIDSQIFWSSENTGGSDNPGKTSENDGKKIAPKPNGTEEDKSSSGNKSNSKENTGSREEEKKFTQVDVDRIISERLQREKEKQEREAKEKQGEFQKLYEEVKPKFDGTITENETLKKRLVAIETAAHKQIDELIKDWPKEVKELDPGKVDFEVRQTWAERVKPLAQKLMFGGKSPNFEAGDKGKSGGKSDNVVHDFMRKRYGTETTKA